MSTRRSDTKENDLAAHPHIVVMGVSGSGKTTVGELLAERLGLPYRDGDDLHPQENIDKMARGEALDDDDRWPWLRLVGQWLHDSAEGGMKWPVRFSMRSRSSSGVPWTCTNFASGAAWRIRSR